MPSLLLPVRVCLNLGDSTEGSNLESNNSRGCSASVSPWAMSMRMSRVASRSRSACKWQSGGSSEAGSGGEKASASRKKGTSGNNKDLVCWSSIVESCRRGAERRAGFNECKSWPSMVLKLSELPCTGMSVSKCWVVCGSSLLPTKNSPWQSG